MSDDVSQQPVQQLTQQSTQQLAQVQPVGDQVASDQANQSVADPATVDSVTADPVTTSSPGGTSSDDKKNPLDVLEQLLSEIDAKAEGKDPLTNRLGIGGVSGADTDAATSEPAGPTPEEIAAQELEQKRIAFEKKKAEQQIIDDQLIAQQRQALEQEMSDGAANVARAQQDEQKKSEETQKKQAEDGFEILQIDHTKI